jgi:drug/metabolite transporter (DMT)-like permease
MAVGLALAASLCYGVSNFLGPAISRDLPVFAVLLAGQLVAFTVSGLLVALVGGDAPDRATAAVALVAGVGNAGGLIFFYRAAAAGPLSIVTPIGSIGAALPVVVGVGGGEPVGPARLAGIVLVLGGVALAARRAASDRAEAAAADVPDRHGAAVVLALLAAAMFGVFLTFMAPASEDGVLWAVMLSRVSLLAIVGASAVALAEQVRVRVADLPRVAVPGILLFAGTLCYSAATREGDLSVVSVLGSLFPVITVGLAFALLGERLGRLQGVGVVAALAGVALVSLRS